MIKKLVKESIYLSSIDNLKKGQVSIFYISNTYRNDVKHINKIAKAIVKDFPLLKYSNMHIYKISPKESNRHADHIAIEVLIPVKDFIKLKESKLIEIM